MKNKDTTNKGNHWKVILFLFISNLPEQLIGSTKYSRFSSRRARQAFYSLTCALKHTAYGAFRTIGSRTPAGAVIRYKLSKREGSVLVGGEKASNK